MITIKNSNLFYNDVEVAQVNFEESFLSIELDLIEDIEDFIVPYKEDYNVSITNDGGYLGIIVDIYDKDELIDSKCFWFDEYSY